MHCQVWRYDPAWLGDLTNGGITFVNILGGVRIAGKPFTASEWNTWGPHRASADMGINPAAAIAYRRDVTESPHNTVVVIDPGKDNIFGKGWSIWNMPAVSSSMEQTKTSIAFGTVPAGLRNVTVISAPAKNLLLTKDNTVTSDTKEIFRNWEEGYQTLDKPRSQIVHGFIGGMPVQLSTVLIKAKAPYSAVAVSSLTDKPIKESGRVLITGISTVRETGVGKAWGMRTKTGYISQTVGGTLTVTSMIVPPNGFSIATFPRFPSGMGIIDPLWILNHLHSADLARDRKRRPFTFSRWCGAGAHRYPVRLHAAGLWRS